MITKNFSLREMACKCGCGSTKMDAGFMIMLQLAREYAGIPFNISSGARCIVHNKRIGGKKDSAHLPDRAGDSHAADITFKDGFQLFIIINALLNAGFRRIGINFKLKFVHVDNDSGKPQDTIFSY